ncbi:unnamed protein product [Ectocarpus sp. 4 AP-2014]|uniref:EsV-1-80 n=1 Tax=Ectocarpus siliculosus virus 1 (isolate New Zealand/Kaikoura/1988) TaxID=654926 RepID=Q8QNJ3_ESV1K|nr:EsV-1-80 [Ectocarpus siliculosus virus 1]AAK14503.1 EsV-1-80 [Ectocarpus siliculosus virus 1]
MLLSFHECPGMENTAPNLYDAIGVSADASADKIRRKTRQLVNEVKESDKRNSEKNELIRFFKSARETLTDSDARKKYDESIGIETFAREERDAGTKMVPYETFQPFEPFGAIGALGGALGNIGSLLGPMQAVPSRSPASSLMGLLGADVQNMFSDSIIPEELASSHGDLKRGSFQVLEYTKVRNPEGGFDEFGFTRQGDMKHDRVTEKRFERKS